MGYDGLVAGGPSRTYEIEASGIRLVAETAGLSHASAALPPGAYTTLRTYGGRSVVRLPQHFRRLEESSPAQGEIARLDHARTRRGLAAALDATGFPESRLRLTFAAPRVFVSVEPFSPLPAALYAEGVAGSLLPLHRDDPHRKDTRFIATADRAYRELPPGVHEGLLTAEDGSILEGLSSNFFAVLDGRLRTEEARALLGVTRALVLEVAGGHLPIQLVAVRREELPRISEAFITSVSREILPLVEIDGQAIGDGRPGPATRALREGFAALVEREAEEI